MCSSSTSGYSACDLAGHLAPEPRRFQHVGLVHRDQLLAPLPGQLEADADDALDLLLGVDHACRRPCGPWPSSSASWACRSRGRRSARAPRSCPPLRRPPASAAWRRPAWARPSPGAGWRRAPAPCAAPAGRPPGAPCSGDRPTWGRPPPPAARRRHLRHSSSVAAVRASPEASMAIPPISPSWKLELVSEALAHRLQHLERLRHHLRADAVAGQYSDVELHLWLSFWSWPVSSWYARSARRPRSAPA